MFPEGHDDGHEYTDEELKAIKTYLMAVERSKEDCSAYKEARDAYEAIFEIPLFGPEDLTDTGILPYYQKTVEKITPGLYKFVFSDPKDESIIEVIEFEVLKKEELTEEDIKGAMPSNIGDLISPSVDLTEEIKEEIKEVIQEENNDDATVDGLETDSETESEKTVEPETMQDKQIDTPQEEQLEDKPVIKNTDE